MVDRNIRVLFWQPNRVADNDLDFGGCLNTISAQPDLINYTNCGNGLLVRAERLNFVNLAWEGDYVRQQTDNLPPIAHAGQPLIANPNPMGHRSAFHYSTEHNILAIQYGRPGVAASAINSYIRRRIPGHKGFFMDPCLSSDAFLRLAAGSPRRLEMRVARPNDLARIDPNFGMIEDSLSALQNFVDGQVVDLSVGFERGQRDALLNRERLLELFRWATGNRGQVKKFKVKLEEETDAIDMFAERMDKRGVLGLDADDLEAAYQTRIDFVRDAFEEHEVELIGLYGQN
ncbi:MAG: hypothetical protein RID11_03875 [Roseovarius sp.]|jgi:hypothetical protein|uniref:hypothetical protein n=1 Tax=Roseovarius sp. TaxID=1486281 RepID=UPI0032EE13ED